MGSCHHPISLCFSLRSQTLPAHFGHQSATDAPIAVTISHKKEMSNPGSEVVSVSDPDGLHGRDGWDGCQFIPGKSVFIFTRVNTCLADRSVVL